MYIHIHIYIYITVISGPLKQYVALLPVKKRRALPLSAQVT